MFGLARAAVGSAIPRDGSESRCQSDAARSPSGTIDRPPWVLGREGRREGGAGLVRSRATADKSPTPINGHPPVQCTCEGFLCSYVLNANRHLTLRQRQSPLKQKVDIFV